jgi:SNF2 family DNA or RNA helicase
MSIMVEPLARGYMVARLVGEAKVLSRMGTIPTARFVRAIDGWKIRATPACAERLFELADGSMGNRIDEAGLGHLSSVMHPLKARRIIEYVNSPTTAWDHQRDAFRFAYGRQACLLDMGMGTGKTKVAFDLMNAYQAHRVLVVCPLSVVDVWERQYLLHRPHGWSMQGGIYPLRGGSVKSRALRLGRTFQEDISTPLIFGMNYEASYLDPMAETLLAQDWDMIVLDEIHRIKAAGGKQSRFMGKLSERAEYRLGLTGTPLPHDILDAYAQFRFLDPGIFGTSHAAFKSRYAIYVQKTTRAGKSYPELIGFQNEEEFRRKYYSITFKVDSSILNLPEPIISTRTCTLHAVTRKAYETLKDEYIVELEEGVVTASNAMVKSLRLRQMAGGFAKPEELDDSVLIDASKLDLLDDITFDIGEPFAVFAEYRAEADAIIARLSQSGLRVAQQRGGINQWQEFQAGDYDVIVCQYQAGGLGIDLTRADICIMYSPTYRLVDYDQSVKRIDRPTYDGRTRAPRLIHLVTEGTMDAKVYRAINERRSIIEALLEVDGE